jgi:hypothetical protein
MISQTLQQGIQERQDELHRIAGILGKAAHVKGRRAAVGKAVVIIMGALVASQAGASKIWGDNNTVISGVYTLLGLTITAVTGLEAAFKTESRSSALKALATQCQITIFQIDTQWQKSLGWYEEHSDDPVVGESQINSAQTLLEMQDRILNDVSSKATELGLNITYAVRQLYNGHMPAKA